MRDKRIFSFFVAGSIFCTLHNVAILHCLNAKDQQYPNKVSLIERVALAYVSVANGRSLPAQAAFRCLSRGQVLLGWGDGRGDVGNVLVC